MTKSLKILARFRKRLKIEISKKTEAFNLLFIMKKHGKGDYTDEDLIELRGYYKGLKVAREILDRTINEYAEQREESEKEDAETE